MHCRKKKKGSQREEKYNAAATSQQTFSFIPRQFMHLFLRSASLLSPIPINLHVYLILILADRVSSCRSAAEMDEDSNKAALKATARSSERPTTQPTPWQKSQGASTATRRRSSTEHFRNCRSGRGQRSRQEVEEEEGDCTKEVISPSRNLLGFFPPLFVASHSPQHACRCQHSEEGGPWSGFGG